MKNLFPPNDQNYTYFQTNRSDDLGSIWSSFGLDFQSNLGTLRVAPRLLINTSTTDDADLLCPVGFEYFDGKIFTVAGTKVFKNADGNQPQSAFTEDTSTSAQTDYSSDVSDLLYYNSALVTSTTDAIYSLNAASGGTWTSRASVTAGVPHPIAYFKKFDRIYFAIDNQSVGSLNTGWSFASSGDYFISLVTTSGALGYVTITSIKTSINRVWIGSLTRNGKGQKGKIFEWDGISAQVTNEYKLDAQGCLALVIDDDIPYAMDSNGCLLKFTGSTFKEIGRLPINTALLKNAESAVNDRFIHPNGLQVTKDGTILALINNQKADSTSSINENFPSGIWEWSEENGFVHKYAFSYTSVGSSTITDFGQNRVSRVGGIKNVNFLSTDAARNGTIMAGATLFTNSTDTNSVIAIDDSNNTIRKKGYVVTTWFQSDEIQDKWNRLWTVFRRLLDATDSMVFKYRLYEEEPVSTTITWVNTTSFTTATDITAYGPTAIGFNGTQGGEVEILQGTGSGSCVHITSIVNNGGTYTVTVDTAVMGVTTGTAKARFQKWIKLNPSVPAAQINSYEQMGIGDSGVRIQIKGCFTFTGNDEFFKFALDSNSDITISP